MSPSRLRPMLILPPALTAMLSGVAAGQEPVTLPALPDAVSTRAPQDLGLAPPEVALAPVPMPSKSTCTPGHCVHRTGFSRRRCKRHLQEAFLGFPEEFERPPLGAMLYAANIAQVRKAEAASMTFYEYDFEPGGPKLNLRGRDKLASVGAKLPANFDPVVVERTGTPIDESRRAALIAMFATGSFPVPPERVVIGVPTGGMRGVEAATIRESSINRVIQGGPPITDSSAGSTPIQGTP